MNTSYLLFLLSERLFGIKLAGAKEIFPWLRPRPVPLSYSYVEGIIDYRGTFYPVYNLGQRLGMKRPAGPIGFTALEPAPDDGAPPKSRSIILIEEKNVPFGIVVDAVLRMTNIEEPKDAPKKVEGIDPKYVKGIVKVEDQDVILLDFERMLNAG